ncbi:hypothetical protein WDW86_17585, partial [Bdellovibrionota bacterium FG-2]
MRPRLARASKLKTFVTALLCMSMALTVTSCNPLGGSPRFDITFNPGGIPAPVSAAISTVSASSDSIAADG